MDNSYTFYGLLNPFLAVSVYTFLFCLFSASCTELTARRLQAVVKPATLETFSGKFPHDDVSNAHSTRKETLNRVQTPNARMSSIVPKAPIR